MCRHTLWSSYANRFAPIVVVNRARPLIFDFVTPAARALAISASRSSGDVRGSASNTSNMNNSSSTRSRRRGNAGGDNNTNSVTATISAMAAAATSAAANATAAAATHSRGLGENYESADGMGMIDDDLGSFAAAAAGAAELAAVAANEAYGAASRELTGAWASRANGPAEEFPSLQVGAGGPRDLCVWVQWLYFQVLYLILSPQTSGIR